MIDAFPVALVFFLGAAVFFALPKGIARATLLLIVPILAGFIVYTLPEGNLWSASLFNLDVEFMRVDKLSRLFGLIFCVAAFLCNLYAWHVRDAVQQVAGLLYAGSAIGAVFAGDLISLFLFWEGTAIASVFLIWARGTEGAFHTGMRYLIIQISSGVILLIGTALFFRETGTIAFDQMTLGSPATWAIFLAFGVKCAFPLMHNWLSDSYPAATVTGTVILSAFTTKLAIYSLARGFAGTEILIYIGAAMTLLPVIHAMVENDLRRVLSYSLNIQLGFMVVGIGIGTELALNGTAAHAFAGILYKALLLMGVGAVLFRTGTAKGSELGGLYKTMPLTMVFCVIGAASISAFPLFSGFVTKSLILSGAQYEGYYVVWGILLFASAAVFHHSGLRVLYLAFFGRDSGLRPKEAPPHMLVAMGATAVLCVGLGVYPDPLYALLPFEVDYVPYTASHVVTQLQLLAFSGLAFALLTRFGLYPRAIRSVTLDTDVVYRWLLPRVVASVGGAVARIWNAKLALLSKTVMRVWGGLNRSHGPEGRLARVWPTGSMVLWLAVLLGVTLIVNFAS